LVVVFVADGFATLSSVMLVTKFGQLALPYTYVVVCCSGVPTASVAVSSSPSALYV
jgi:hypothetical protein